MAWMLPCRALIGDQDVRGKKTERRSAHFHSLITFTGPQSHLRNHGDADKVTHDYSSMAPPDWTAPRALRSVFISAACVPALPQYALQEDEGESLLRSVSFSHSPLVLTSPCTSPLFPLITCPLVTSHPFLSALVSPLQPLCPLPS